MITTLDGPAVREEKKKDIKRKRLDAHYGREKKMQ